MHDQEITKQMSYNGAKNTILITKLDMKQVVSEKPSRDTKQAEPSTQTAKKNDKPNASPKKETPSPTKSVTQKDSSPASSTASWPSLPSSSASVSDVEKRLAKLEARQEKFDKKIDSLETSQAQGINAVLQALAALTQEVRAKN